MRNHRVYDMPNGGETFTFAPGTLVEQLGWTPDGHVLTASTSAGEASREGRQRSLLGRTRRSIDGFLF